MSLTLAYDDNGQPVEDYPADLCAANFDGHSFAMFDHERYFQSTLYLMADLDVRCLALEMFLKSQKRRPVGSLPYDELELAAFLAVDLRKWRSLNDRRIGPLYKWRKYSHEGGLIWGHPVVIEVCRRAVGAAEKRQRRTNKNADAKRMTRLAYLMKERGVPGDLIGREDFMAQADAYLLEHFSGTRRQGAVFEEVFLAMCAHLGIRQEISYYTA